MDKSRLIILIQGFLEGDLTAGEMEELRSMVIPPDNHDDVVDAMAEIGMAAEPVAYDESRFEPILSSIVSSDKVTPLRGLRPRLLRRLAVAASIALVLAAGAYLVFRPKAKPPVVATITHDVKAPQNNRATITLSNGKKVFLDSASNGQLAMQNNVQLIKTSNGQIQYQPTANSQQPTAVYNTLSNPRGSKVIEMTLADGSKVWLNAESSITYPVVFTGSDRKVTMTGEAYFEVKHDNKQPFEVEVNGVEVKDIGTHFNINAYNDEADTKVTLLQGSVRVSGPSANSQQLTAVTLTPGQQAIINHKSQIINRTSNIDLNEVMAWKNNKFYFMSEDIRTIMRELSRWYNVDVIYESDVPDHFTGIISRDVNASEVFRMLEQTGEVKVRIEGNKVNISN